MHRGQIYEADITGQIEDSKFQDWLNSPGFVHRYFSTTLKVLGDSVAFPVSKAWHRLSRTHPDK